MQYLSLKSDTIEKISPRSEGKIHYRVLTDAKHESLYLVFTGNDDGGHFSDEIVPFERIEKCVEGFKVGTYVASKQFFKAFESRSNNNCGFLAAILRAEELLAPVVDGEKRHVLQPGWDGWKELMLTETSELWEPPVKVVAKPKAKGKAVSNAKSK
jgi:uncharacterized UPF0160 family protein